MQSLPELAHGFFPTWTEMVIVDVALIAVVGLGTVVMARNWRALRHAGAHRGLAMILAGFWVIMALFFGNLIALSILPSRLGIEKATDMVHDIHSGISFYVVGVASVLFVTGLIMATLSVVRQLRGIEKQNERLRLNEDLLNSIFENVPVGLLIKDAQHRIDRVNQTYCDWYGFDKSFVRGKRSESIEGFQPDDDASRMLTQEREVMDTGMRRERQIERAFNDGNMHIVNITKFPIFDEHDNPIGVGSVSIDMTDQVNTQRALATALQEAEIANRSKSQFLATMSHEFRTPLNAILGFSEFLLHQAFGPLGNDRYVTYVEDIHASGKHMLSLVNDVLDISTIEAGKRKINVEQIEIRSVLDECANHVRPTVDAKSIELRVEIASGAVTMKADRRAVVQVVLNLLSNAVKFTDAGGSITIAAAHEGAQTLLTISDTGVGIPKERIKDVTLPFTQDNANPLVTQSGTGLGLSIVKSLVEMHGGKFIVESNLHQGTTVTAAFPN